MPICLSILGPVFLSGCSVLEGWPLFRMHCIFGWPLSSSFRILWTNRAPLEDSNIFRIRTTWQMSMPRLRAKGNFLRILCPDIEAWVPSLLLKVHVLSCKGEA